MTFIAAALARALAADNKSPPVIAFECERAGYPVTIPEAQEVYDRHHAFLAVWNKAMRA